MLTCRKVAGMITAHLEGALSIWQSVRFRFHLLVCPSCRTHLGKMERLIQALPRVSSHQNPPDDVIENLSKLDG